MSAQGQKSEHDNVATEKKQPKERRFVDAKTGKTIEKPKHGGSGAAATQALRDEMHAERAGNALPFRIGAAVLWVVPRPKRTNLPTGCRPSWASSSPLSHSRR